MKLFNNMLNSVILTKNCVTTNVYERLFISQWQMFLACERQTVELSLSNLIHGSYKVLVFYVLANNFLHVYIFK